MLRCAAVIIAVLIGLASLAYFAPVTADPCPQFHVDEFYPNGPDCR